MTALVAREDTNVFVIPGHLDYPAVAGDASPLGLPSNTTGFIREKDEGLDF